MATRSASSPSSVVENGSHKADFRPQFRTAYDGAQEFFSTSSALDCSGDPGLTKQSFKDQCDINNIMAKFDYDMSLVRDDLNNARGDFLDLATMPSYHDSLNAVLAANQAFADLPASIRKRFDNDPAEFLLFVHDPKNRDEMRTMGLLKDPEKIPDPVSVRVVADPNAPTADELRAQADKLVAALKGSNSPGKAFKATD